MTEYINFIFRDVPPHDQFRGIEVLPNFYPDSFKWTIFFTVLQLLSTWGAKTLFPQWYANLTARKKIEFPAYFSCLVFHFTVVPYGLKNIITDFLRDPAELATIQYALIEAPIVPYTVGYLAGDTLCYVIPMLFQNNYEMFFHHVFGLGICLGAINAPGHYGRYYSHVLICEVTNICFNLAWLMRLTPLKENFLVSVFEVLFIITFFFTRIINLPLVVLAANLKEDAAEFGIARYMLIFIVLLQFYWFKIIVEKSYERFFLKEKKEDKKQK
jgi:hypothetical protein